MTPILYSKNETAFTSQGLGALSDAIKCSVYEERNGTYELTMMYPVTGSRFNDLNINNIIYAVPSYKKDPEPFRIYRVSKPLNGVVTVYAEHISYQLSFVPVKLFEADTVASALNGLKTNSIEDNPFEFWTDKTNTKKFKNEVPASCRSLLGGTKGSILDVYGGEFEFNKFLVKLWNRRGSDNGVTIEYGKNLTDFTQEEDIQNTITGVSPIYVSRTGQVRRGQTQYCDTTLRNSYPFRRTVVVDFSSDFDEMPTVEQLQQAAQAYIERNDIGKPNVNLKVSFVALAGTTAYKDYGLLERVNLCDTVTVRYPLLGVDVKAKVVRTDFDVLTEQYNTVEIGSARGSLANTIMTIEQENGDNLEEAIISLEKAIDKATESIVGINGGYVVLKPDANGRPQEILVMDTDSTETATKVWRWNLNGLGYSRTGIDGPYTTAITQNGEIVADFISVGQLTANLIKAGVLSDAAGNYSLSLATGTVNMKNANITGGRINIVSDAQSSDNISLTYSNFINKMTPIGMDMKNTTLNYAATYQAGGATIDSPFGKGILGPSSVTFSLDAASAQLSRSMLSITDGAGHSSTVNTTGLSVRENGDNTGRDYTQVTKSSIIAGHAKSDNTIDKMATLGYEELSFLNGAKYPAMSTPITNLDATLNTGIYRFEADAVGNPLGSNQGLMFAIRFGTNSGFQLVTSNRGGTVNRRKMMIRHRYSGNWTPWATINASVTPIGTVHESATSSERLGLAFLTATWDTSCSLEVEEGVWWVTGYARWATKSAGDRRLYVGTSASGTQQHAITDANDNARTPLHFSTVITNSSSSNQTIYLRVYHTAGESISLDGSGVEFNGIRAVKIGEVQA